MARHSALIKEILKERDAENRPVLEQAEKLIRENLIETKLREHNLPKEYCSDFVMEQLRSCKEEMIDVIIGDRKQIAAKAEKTVKEAGAAAAGKRKDDAKFTAESFAIEAHDRGLHTVVERLRDGKEGAEGDRRSAERFVSEVMPEISQELGKPDEKKSQALAKVLREFSVKEMFVECTGQYPRHGHVKEAAILSSGFTIITTALLGQKGIDSYNITGAGMVGDSLVDPYPSKLKLETYAGFNAAAGVAAVAEGDTYPDATITEKYVTDTAFSKKGVKVKITEEAILFDETGRLMSEARNVGNQLRVDRERMIILSILDVAPYRSYYPSGAQAILFSAANANLVLSNPFVDFTSLRVAHIALGAFKDSNNDPIMDNDLKPLEILNPRALMDAIDDTISALELEQPSSTSSNSRVQRRANPFRGTKQFTSKLIDPLTIASNAFDGENTWLLAGAGGFKKQYFEKIHFPFEAAPLPSAEVAGISADIVGVVRFRYKSRVFALDHRYVVKCVSEASGS